MPLSASRAHPTGLGRARSWFSPHASCRSPSGSGRSTLHSQLSALTPPRSFRNSRTGSGLSTLPLQLSTRRRGRAAAAFTLIELLTVLAIIGLLSAVVIGVGRRASESGKIARAKAELATLSTALGAYQRQYGDYPQTQNSAELLQALIGQRGPTGAAMTSRSLVEMARFTTANSLAPFNNVAAQLVDPWGQPYVYACAAKSTGWTNPSYVLYSIGPDGKDDATLLTGGFANTAAADNVDNLYANRN